ncbi:MAG: NAD-binding protein [Nostocaceae cyanobacterium]|nr:NAD-binding protein [Nostocaceae cyanobacterium]
MVHSSKRIYKPAVAVQSGLNNFLVCGLGSLGQYCAIVLKEFGVKVGAIDRRQCIDWEIPELPDLLDEVIVGDCRQIKVFQGAKIEDYQVILLVTSDEQVNIQAAFTARLLHPQIRLVIRSGKYNLNQLLSQNLGNFVALEPSQLAASAFALAAVGSETLACFSLDEELIQVVQRRIQRGDYWCNQRQMYELNSHLRRILSYSSPDTQTTNKFYEWEPEHRLQEGDTIVYVERGKQLTSLKPVVKFKPKVSNFHWNWQKLIDKISGTNLKLQILNFWHSIELQSYQRVILICGITVLLLGFTSVITYRLFYPQVNFLDAFHATASLLLGGYGDVFGGVKLEDAIPVWLHLFSLGLALAGTAFIGVLYAMLTENLLSARFQFLIRRPPIPKRNHVILIGLGGLGQGIAQFLQEFKQPLVVIDNQELERSMLPQIPLVTGDIIHALDKVNLPHAKSIIVATDDQMINLEIGLIAHNINSQAWLVIRMLDLNFSETSGQLLPYAKVLCTEVLAAEAFVAAAFGENILSLFHSHNQTVLVTEYNIASDDTLQGLLLAEVAYGYGVVPILYQKSTRRLPKWMPADDIRLRVGDRLVVLATIEGIKSIEQGNLASTDWQVRVEKAIGINSTFEGAITIARIAGFSLAMATRVMEQLPVILPKALYKHQAHRLVHELNKVQVVARLLDNS